MRFERSAPFDADVRRLPVDQLRVFRDVVRDRFVPAAERHIEQPGPPWPRALRVRAVAGVSGVWELTWFLSGPDGRATFEWIEIDGEPAIRWRRIGGHEIFGEP